MSNEKLEQVRNHKETIEKTLYQNESYNKWDDGTLYPKSRVKVDYITYEWEYLDKDKNYQKYTWQKIKVVISKLTLNQWNIEVAKKSYVNKEWKAYSVNDQKEISFTIDEFNDLLSNVKLDDLYKKEPKDKKLTAEDLPY